MSRTYIGAVLVLFAAFGYGLMPIFIKFAYMGGINTSTLLLLRFAIAAALFFIYILIRSIKISVNLKQLAELFALGGVCYTVQSFLYFSAVKYIPGALATLLLYISPAIVAIMSFFIFKEKANAKVVSAIAVSFIGLAIVCSDSFGRMSLYGILAALGAAVVYSTYIILGNKVVNQLPAVVSSAFITLFTSVSLLVAGMTSGSISFDFKPEAWLPVAGIVLLSTVLAVAAFLAGLERLGSTKASILGMMEPVFAVIFSVIFLSEKLSFYQLLGGAIVLTGVVIVVRSNSSEKKSGDVGESA